MTEQNNALPQGEPDHGEENSTRPARRRRGPGSRLGRSRSVTKTTAENVTSSAASTDLLTEASSPVELPVMEDTPSAREAVTAVATTASPASEPSEAESPASSPEKTKRRSARQPARKRRPAKSEVEHPDLTADATDAAALLEETSSSTEAPTDTAVPVETVSQVEHAAPETAVSEDHPAETAAANTAAAEADIEVEVKAADIAAPSPLPAIIEHRRPARIRVFTLGGKHVPPALQDTLAAYPRLLADAYSQKALRQAHIACEPLPGDSSHWSAALRWQAPADIDYQLAIVLEDDALHHPVADWLLQRYTPDELSFAATTPALLRAFYRLGVPWQHAQFVDISQQGIRALRGYLRDQQIFAIRFAEEDHSTALCHLLRSAGLAHAQLWLFERDDLENGQIQAWHIHELEQAEPFPLSQRIAVLCTPEAGLGTFPGHSDDWLHLPGEPQAPQLLPGLVRLGALSALQASNSHFIGLIGDLGWSIALELAHQYPGLRIGIWLESEVMAYRLRQLVTLWGWENRIRIQHAHPGQTVAVASLWTQADRVVYARLHNGPNDEYADVWHALRGNARLVAVATTELQKGDLLRFATQQPASCLSLQDIALTQAGYLEHGLVMTPQPAIRLGAWRKPND